MFGLKYLLQKYNLLSIWACSGPSSCLERHQFTVCEEMQINLKTELCPVEDL
jgi:hypothetical protein